MSVGRWVGADAQGCGSSEESEDFEGGEDGQVDSNEERRETTSKAVMERRKQDHRQRVLELDREKEVAGGFMGLMLTVGLTVGSLGSFAIRL